MKLFLKISLVILLVGIIALRYVLYQVAPYGIVLENRYTKVQLAQMLGNRTLPTDYGLKYEAMSVTVEDTITLKGWYIPSEKKSRATVIVLHGIGASKEFMLTSAQMLSRDGFNVVLFDLRGNGESGGTYCTLGYYEKNDISEIVDYLLERDPSQEIGVYGNSLGGAIALMAMANDKRIKCGVIESTFANLREVISDYFIRLFYVGPMFISNIALDKAGELAKFNPDDVNPEIYAQKVDQPVFIAHGDKDKNINFKYGLRIYKKLKSKQKQWHLVRGAGHTTLYSVGDQIYIHSILDFLHRNLGE
jgi:dipeptidyl aminopeptidase/acylaminoacyl peptidase